ncbi:hypothetical protein [Flavihumibacter sp. UBA7668]|uniref:hypothetical protein n=1 Tax=Flavihumibacter sp. UBA7668 TaxID=1946542 RepID=UPI0025C62FF0|nr:hypothetical protein [Flavihumibacter sp. UBA7668]
MLLHWRLKGKNIRKDIQDEEVFPKWMPRWYDPVLNKVTATQQPKLCIPSLKGFQVIEINDILYCEASVSYTNFIFVQQPSICSAKPIHDYEELLSDAGFVRVQAV